MDNRKTYDNILVTNTWGMLLIWLGLWWGIPVLRGFIGGSLGFIGVGLILLGLNAVRFRKDFPTNPLTTALGALAVALGLGKLVRWLLHLPPFEFPLGPILLLTVGIAFLGRGLSGIRYVRKSGG